MSFPHYISPRTGTSYTLEDLGIDWHFSDAGVKVPIPAYLVQEKLRELGFEIRGPGKKPPAIFRTSTDSNPKIYLEVAPGVHVWVTLGRLQQMIRNANYGEFDIYPVKRRKDGWS